MKHLVLLLAAFPFLGSAAGKPIKLFIVAGDELVLEQGVIEGRTDGVFDAFYPNGKPSAGEEKNHVNCAVYAGAYSASADASSPRMAAEYGKHLPNLIRDLRKDLGRPQLPVVVGAIGWDAAHAGPVREAQLAASEPSNNIVAVDTLPLLRAPGLSPGTRADSYHSNAEAFLLIGEAMGTEIMRLVK